MGKRRDLYCSFCGKAQHEVVRMIAGPQVFTCNECVEMFVAILRDEGIAPFSTDGKVVRLQMPTGSHHSPIRKK